MDLLTTLPNLNKTFCNFELGLDAEHELATASPNEEYQAFETLLQMDDDTHPNYHDITTNSECSASDKPPSIEPDSEYSDSSRDTDDDMGLPPHSRARKRNAKYQRQMKHNPHIYTRSNKQDSISYNNKYKNCHWSLINMQRPKQSFVGFFCP